MSGSGDARRPSLGDFMISWRHPYRVALALFAFGVLGSSLAFACLYRTSDESILDVIRGDVIAGATAQAELRFAEAEQHYRRVVEATGSASDRSYDEAEHAWALVQLGDVLEAEGRIDEAEHYYRQALAIANPEQDPYDESALLPLAHLRDLYASAGDTARAEGPRAQIASIVSRVEPIYLRAIALQRRLKHGDKSHLADDLMRLANLYCERGDDERSAPLYEEVFAIRSRKGAGGGGDVLGPLIRLGAVNADAGREDVATAMLRETLAERESRYGPRSPYLIKNLCSLGALAYRQSRLAEADSLFTRALAIEEDRLGPNHPYSASILASLADCSRDEGRFESARAYQLRLIGIRSRVYGPESRMVAAGLLDLAKIEAAAGDRVAARDVCGEARDVAEKTAGTLDPLTAECASTMRQLQRYLPEAEPSGHEKVHQARPDRT